MEGFPIPSVLPQRCLRARSARFAAVLIPAVLNPAMLIPAVLLPAVLLAAAPASAAVTTARASARLQDSSGDTVHTLSARTGKRAIVTGTVTENGLAEVVLTQGDKETRIESVEVERIAWGGVTPDFREADIYFERGDFENSATRFRQALDAEERAVVKAVALRRIGESLLRLGASDSSKYTEAVAEFDRFISDYSKDRALPEVRWMKGRAALLGGDAKTAATEFGALYHEGAGTTPTPGYDMLLCARAGVAAAQAQLAAGETLAAREMFGVVRNRLSEMLSQAEPGNPAAVELGHLAAEADLGEGFVLIANDQGAQAKPFFNARFSNADSSPTTRFGALLGLAEAHYRQQEFSEARLAFARVAALDYTSRDRVAHALVRMAQCRVQLKDGDWKPAARTWLEDVVRTYGDTPAAFEARQVLPTL